MPIKVQSDLPAKEILEHENIFVMDENRAMHQDIRPLQVCILNLMPVKQDTELQLLRALSNTPIQVDVTFLMVTSHVSLNTSVNHLNRFYTTFEEVKKKRFDGLIITGAPVEDIAFEEVDYWEEICDIMDWAEEHVTSTLHICWGAQAGFYHYYGLGVLVSGMDPYDAFIREMEEQKKSELRDIILMESTNDFDGNAGALYEYMKAHGSKHKFVWIEQKILAG